MAAVNDEVAGSDQIKRARHSLASAGVAPRRFRHRIFSLAEALFFWKVSENDVEYSGRKAGARW